MVKIFTSTYNYTHANRLDITSKTKDPIGKIFAPPWSLVKSYKWEGLSKEEYTENYLKLLRIQYKQNYEAFEKVLNLKTVVFVCYCKPKDFCHRFILADCFVKLGANYLGEI